MATIYNPNSRITNCGFCALAYALFLQGVNTDADRLYRQTLDRLDIPHPGNADPIPRRLIFPDPLIDRIPLPVEYQALADHGHGPSSYTITSVASANNLRHDPSRTNPDLPRQFFEFYSRTAPERWDIADFVQMRLRLNRLRSHGKTPSAEAVRRQVLGELGGHSIIGSKTMNHFINMEIDRSGHIKAYDAQDGKRYNGASLHTRMRTLDLFIHLR